MEHQQGRSKALGDDKRSSAYIETVSRSGHRFVAPVSCEQDDRHKVPLHAEDSSAPEEGAARPVDSLAVLPFADLSPQEDQEYFCDGLADELINALTRIRGLRVMSRTSSFQFKGASVDVREIGKRLGVRAVLEGSVRKSGERLRVTARVTDVESGFTLSSEQHDRFMADVLEIQTDIAQRVVEALEVHVSDSERRVLENRLTADPRAYDLYLQGRGLFYQVPYETLVKARDKFREAIDVDASFAIAHSALAEVCSFLYQWRGRRPELLTEARAGRSDQALDTLEESLDRAVTNLAWIANDPDWNDLRGHPRFQELLSRLR